VARVAAAPHRFGGIEYRVGRRELGHVHGSRLVATVIELFRLNYERRWRGREGRPLETTASPE
jgi:hypothetical protein